MEQIVVDNRYAVSRPLGGGGMANVYLAHDEVLDRDVAIKLLREQYADDEEFVERFKREAQSAANLSHPHIVQIYDRGRSQAGDYYIAMEYVPGGTLKDRLVRDGALAPGVAAGVAEQIADALSAAHDRGVVHRDIKPQNVLVTRSGDVKVTDFGIARAASASSVTSTDVILGTAGYMSPEQARGETVGPASDLYSLGIVLYEMLTGNLPYEAENPMALALRHVNGPVPSPREDNPEVPEALDAVTTRLLAKDPAARYPSASALANDLDRIQSGRVPAVVDAGETQIMTAPLAPLPQTGSRTARTAVRRPTNVPPRSGYRPVQARRRSRLWLALLALLFAVALLAGIAWSLTRDLNLPSPAPPAQQQVPQVTVPDVTDLPEAEAVARLQEAGLEAAPQPRESGFDQQGLVMAQDPASGVRLDEGETVTVFVGSGPSSVTVPDLLWESDAAATLQSEGLVFGGVTYETNDVIPAGQVIRTDPAEGAGVEPGTAVTVVVSSGPAQQYAAPPAPGGGDAFQDLPEQPQNEGGEDNSGSGGGGEDNSGSGGDEEGGDD